MSQEVRKANVPFEIWTAQWPAPKGHSLTRDHRPVVVISGDSDETLPYVSVVPLDWNLTGKQSPTHVLLCHRLFGVPSCALCEQVMTIEKKRLIRCIGCVDDAFDRFALRRAIATHLNLMDAPGELVSQASLYAMCFDV